MVNGLRGKVNQLKEKVNIKNTLKVSREELEKERIRLFQIRYDLREEVKDKEKGINELKEISLNTLLLTIKGEKVKRIEKEEEDYFNVKAKCDEIEKEYNEVKDKVEALDIKIEELKEVAEEYEEAYEEIKSLYLNSPSFEGYDQLVELNSKEEKLVIELNNLDKTVVAVEDLLSDVNKALSAIGDARGWGVLDMMNRGNILAYAAKYGSIYDAQVLVNKIKKSIKNFEDNFKDMELPNIKGDNATFLWDVLTDVFINDLAVQVDICNFQTKLRYVRKEIREYFKDINEVRDKEIVEIESINNKIKDIIGVM
ncbi:hypothetical protein [Clostridium sp. LP20]|uniref:hypothetical protein n=1 Tax=Clostridium sp. LP20 TaxID=3418665 RepID=UPI003EE70F9D